MAVDELVIELEALTAPAVACRACGTPYPVHGDAGGPVTVRVGGWSSPAAALPVRCPGFRWVSPESDRPTYG